MRHAALLFAITASLLLPLGCGPKTYHQRLNSSERLASEADDLLGRAERALEALEPDRARSYLDDARQVLLKSDSNLYPEYEMLKDRLKADDARLPVVASTRAKRDTDREVAERREAIARAEVRYQQALDRLAAKDLRHSDLEAFDRAEKDLREELKPAELEKRSETWAAVLKAHREFVERSASRAAAARERVAFLEGPAAASLAARKLLPEVRQAKSLEDKVALEQQVVAKLDECAKGKKFLERSQALAASTVWLGGEELAPKAVVRACAKNLAAAKKTLVKLRADATRESKDAERKRRTAAATKRPKK